MDVRDQLSQVIWLIGNQNAVTLERPIPSAAMDVNTQGTPATRLEITLPFMPEPNRIGATVSRSNSNHGVTLVSALNIGHRQAVRPACRRGALHRRY